MKAKQPTYHQAMKLINKFCQVAEANYGNNYFAYGFLQSFAAQALSGRTIEHSLKVLEQITNDLDTATAPVSPLHIDLANANTVNSQ